MPDGGLMGVMDVMDVMDVIAQPSGTQGKAGS